MASTVLDPIADSIAGLLTGLGVTPTVQGVKWVPKQLTGTGPWGVVQLPEVRRTVVGDRESQLGSDDWFLDYPVPLYFDLRDAPAAQQRAAETVEAFIKAVDANPTLGDPTVDAAVHTATPDYTFDEKANRPVLVYDTTVAVQKLVG